MTIILLLFVCLLSALLGFELVNKVPSQLHTPLMSGTNAVSGITIVGAILAGNSNGMLASILAFIAIILATINVVGGYCVTDRMLKFFKKK